MAWIGRERDRERVVSLRRKGNEDIGKNGEEGMFGYLTTIYWALELGRVVTKKYGNGFTLAHFVVR